MSDVFTRWKQVSDREDTTLDYNQVAGTIASSGSFSAGRKGQLSSIEDNNNPGWRQRQNRGEIVMSGMRLNRVKRTFTPGTLAYGEPGYSISWTGDMCAMVETSFDPGNELDQYNVQMRELAMIKAFAKITDSSVQAGEFIKDLGSTMSMLRRPFSTAQNLLVNIERKAQRKLSRIGRERLNSANVGRSNRAVATAYADAWLETQYGWKPLIMDIETIYNSSTALNGTLQRRNVVRASEEASYTRSQDFKGVSFTSPLDVLLGDGQYTSSCKTRVSAGVIFDLVNRNASVTGSQFFGVRARDLPVTFWQILPYSFVVDWFFNVESWIKASTPNPDISIRGSWTTLTSQKTRKTSGTSRYEWPTNPPRTCLGSLGSSETTIFQMERETNRSAPNRPTLNMDFLTFNRTISGLSLMVRPLIKGLMSIGSKMSP